MFIALFSLILCIHHYSSLSVKIDHSILLLTHIKNTLTILDEHMKIISTNNNSTNSNNNSANNNKISSNKYLINSIGKESVKVDEYICRILRIKTHISEKCNFYHMHKLENMIECINTEKRRRNMHKLTNRVMRMY